MSKTYRRRGSDHRRRSSHRGYDRRGHGHNDRRHGRHQVSPLTKGLTTIALWIIVIVALANGMIQFPGK